MTWGSPTRAPSLALHGQAGACCGRSPPQRFRGLAGGPQSGAGTGCSNGSRGPCRPARRHRRPRVFAARCGARERERQLGNGYGFGIFVGPGSRPLRGRDQPVVRAAGALSERLRRLLDRRGRGRPLLRAGGVRGAVPLRLRGSGLHRLQASIIPRNGPATGWRRSWACATRASPCATWRSTASGRTTCATPSPPRTGLSGASSYLRDWILPDA